MDKIKIWFDDPDTRQIGDICRRLQEGEIGIIPTDSLYGICCDALNVKGINKVCRIKGINPEKMNLSIICADISMASEYARIDNDGFRLLRDNTPGAFTFLFKSASTLPKAFKERRTVGIRIPANNLCRAVAARLGNPVLTTSIEYVDTDHAVNPDLIAERYQNLVDFFVEDQDGGTVPTTIVDCTGSEPVITRQGASELT